MKEERLSRGWRIFILVVSIVLPLAIAMLGVMPKVEVSHEGLRKFINCCPTINATLNGTTFFILIAAFLAIRRKNIVLHRRLITTAMILSVAFLSSYVTYHLTTEHAIFAGSSSARTTYLIILNSHILLSGVIIPLVLVSYARGLSGMVAKHKKIARVALPMWLYVAASGVVVYLMISPYYNF